MRKRVGKRIGKPRPERVSPLPVVICLDDGKPAVGRGSARVLVQGLGYPSIFGVVLPHEPLVLPLPLGAVAEEQDGGIVNGGTDDEVTGYSSVRTDGSRTSCRGPLLQT